MEEIKRIYAWLNITKRHFNHMMREILSEGKLTEIMHVGHECLEDLTYVEDYLRNLEEKLPF